MKEDANAFRAGLPDGIHIFKPKIQIWENFGGPWNGKGCYILWPFGITYCHLAHFMAISNLVAIWYIFPILVYCVKINLATLFQRTATKWNGFC
jgi:hypothetical protein